MLQKEQDPKKKRPNKVRFWGGFGRGIRSARVEKMNPNKPQEGTVEG